MRCPKKACERSEIYLILKMGKMGHFKKFEHKKSGHFKKLARDQFSNRKSTENKIARFWGISNKNA